MFDDARSKRVILVAHCLLNQNSISDGTADFASQFEELIELLMDRHIGILQLPCPELMCLGLQRQDIHGGTRPVLEENTRIQALLKAQAHQQTLHKLIDGVVFQLNEYKRNDVQVIGVIGVNRSPSCGVNTTTEENREVNGRGVFLGLLKQEFARRELSMPMIGVKTSQQEESVHRVRKWLEQL